MFNFTILNEAVQASVAAKGNEFFSWKNAPVTDAAGAFSQLQGWGDAAKAVNLSAQEAEAVYTAKLDGAYGERFVLSVALLPMLLARGYDVQMIQLAEDGSPFDASGWLVLAIEGMPLFHISPTDLFVADVEEIVEVVPAASDRAKYFAWKGTNKVGEFTALLQAVGATERIDFVAVAQAHSK